VPGLSDDFLIKFSGCRALIQIFATATKNEQNIVSRAKAIQQNFHGNVDLN
jgi:hypothetical protein